MLGKRKTYASSSSSGGGNGGSASQKPRKQGTQQSTASVSSTNNVSSSRLSPPQSRPQSASPVSARLESSRNAPQLTLKQVRTALKTLVAQLTVLEEEWRWLDRLWYKNAAQFRSAIWWKAVDGVRRPLKQLFAVDGTGTAPPKASASSRFQRRRGTRASEQEQVGNDTTAMSSVARNTARLCVSAYSETWAPLPPPPTQLPSAPVSTSSASAWPTVPKYRPSATVPPFSTGDALDELAYLQRVLLCIRTRALKAGTVLALHLNTPPAPTFAPVVTALLAIIASVHTATAVLLDPSPRDTVLYQLNSALAHPAPPSHKSTQ